MQNNLYTRKLPPELDRRFTLLPADKEKIRALHAAGERVSVLAKKYKVTTHTIYRCVDPEKYQKQRSNKKPVSREKVRDAMRRMRAYRRLIFRGSPELIRTPRKKD